MALWRRHNRSLALGHELAEGPRWWNSGITARRCDPVSVRQAVCPRGQLPSSRVTPGQGPDGWWGLSRCLGAQMTSGTDALPPPPPTPAPTPGHCNHLPPPAQPTDGTLPRSG